jgi:meiosis arrest female protein 1
MQPLNSDRFLPPLAVFWDIQNCKIPRGKSALTVCEKIRGEDFFLGHSEIQFAVVCDAAKESPAVLDDLHKAQVGPTFKQCCGSGSAGSTCF